MVNSLKSPTDTKKSIIVYGMLQSIATQRVLATLNEKGLIFELKIVNIMAGEHLVSYDNRCIYAKLIQMN